jgi:hypothetical protein
LAAQTQYFDSTRSKIKLCGGLIGKNQNGLGANEVPTS